MGYRIRKFRDTRFGRKPRNAVEALRQARALLVDEPKRWIKGAEYAGRCSTQGDLPKKFNPDNPLCGSWGVCAIGSVALVTGDLAVKDPEDDLRAMGHETFVSIEWPTSGPYSEAIRLLNDVTGGDIVTFNDTSGTKRKDVIKQFDKAIAKGKAEANRRRGRNSARTKYRTLTGVNV